MDNKIDIFMVELERVISRNMDTRKMDKVKLENQLKNVAYDLNESKTVVAVTGFYVKDMNTGETDGPIGTLSVAYALENLGKKVIIVSDEYSEAFMRKGMEILNLKSDIYIANQKNSRMTCENIIENYKPCHVLSIERPGKTKEGKYYSMLGVDITEFVPDLDYLFEIAKSKGIKTSAVGDGGNEIGMGKISDYVKTHIMEGEKIAAITQTDNLIVAGVSNWGGHAMSAALSLINHRNLMYDEDIEIKILQEIVNEGAVDGCLKKQSMTVDGLSLEENLNVFTSLLVVVKNFLSSIST